MPDREPNVVEALWHARDQQGHAAPTTVNRQAPKTTVGFLPHGRTRWIALGSRVCVRGCAFPFRPGSCRPSREEGNSPVPHRRGCSWAGLGPETQPNANVARRTITLPPAFIPSGQSAVIFLVFLFCFLLARLELGRDLPVLPGSIKRAPRWPWQSALPPPSPTRPCAPNPSWPPASATPSPMVDPFAFSVAGKSGQPATFHGRVRCFYRRISAPWAPKCGLGAPTPPVPRFGGSEKKKPGPNTAPGPAHKGDQHRGRSACPFYTPPRAPPKL